MVKPRLTDMLRKADLLELPDTPGVYIEAYTSLWGGEKPPCCAIGGANVARGEQMDIVDGKITNILSFMTLEHMEVDNIKVPARCPVCGKNRAVLNQLESCVIHLYDDHRLSRTEIADMLEGADV